MCVMSHTSEASILMSHVACINAPIRPRVAVCCSVLQCVAVCCSVSARTWHWNGLCHTYEWVMSHIWMSHVFHMNESWHTYEWVTLHVCESCHTYEWVMSHIWMSHVFHMNESWHTYEWVTLHVCSHAKHINQPCHTYEWVMPQICMGNVLFVQNIEGQTAPKDKAEKENPKKTHTQKVQCCPTFIRWLRWVGSLKS